MDFQEQDKLFKVRKTALEMVNDRGFNVPLELNITFEQFKVQYNENNIDIYIHDTEKNKKFYLHFYYGKSFSKNNLKDLMTKIIEKYQDDNINVILILKDKENAMVTKELNKPNYKNVEIFLQDSLVFNITHHVLVPKHSVMNEEEEKELNFNKNELPRILKTDPVAKYYGMKTGQICKIERTSNVSGFTYYYRLVK